MIDTASGPFSTEAPAPDAVRGQVEAAIREVLGDAAVVYCLVDESGGDRTLEVAARQAGHLQL